MIRRASGCPVVYCCHGRWASLSANELPISLWADNDPVTTTWLPYVFPTCHITRNCILACWSLTVWYYWWYLLYLTAALHRVREEWKRDTGHGCPIDHSWWHTFCDRVASCSSCSARSRVLGLKGSTQWFHSPLEEKKEVHFPTINHVSSVSLNYHNTDNEDRNHAKGASLFTVI